MTKHIIPRHRRRHPHRTAPAEVAEMWYSERMVPEGIKVYNPAFDVTDDEFITEIITKNGVWTPASSHREPSKEQYISP